MKDSFLFDNKETDWERWICERITQLVKVRAHAWTPDLRLQIHVLLLIPDDQPKNQYLFILKKVSSCPDFHSMSYSARNSKV